MQVWSSEREVLPGERFMSPQQGGRDEAMPGGNILPTGERVHGERCKGPRTEP